jgi:hypothetical protein
MLLSTLSLAALLNGCGSDKKEGGDSLADLKSAGADTSCIQCHSAVLDPLTNEGKMAQYVRSSPHKDSTHLGSLNGCEACHGGAAQHEGVGPIAYVNPYDGNGVRCAECHKGPYATNAPTKFAASKHANVVIEEGNPCRRCHTHEGAVMGAAYGLTGNKALLETAAYQGAVPLAKEYTQFKCATCHEHGGGLRLVKTRDASGNVVNWNPSGSNLQNDQYNLCTSCHNLKDNAGTLMASGSTASGTVAVGHHEDGWFRVIASTHNNNSDNPANGISGYVIRVKGENPCFDCHAHEAKTNTNNQNPAINTDALASSTRAGKYNAADATIYSEWAKSGHAGGLLSAKYAAVGLTSRSVAQVDTAMNASVNDTTAAAWNHYDWSGADRQDCQRCHTATGAANFLKNPAAYDKTANDFSHLAGWKTSAKASKQRELLYCWGCHSNAGAGVIRNPGVVTAEYNFKGTKAVFPDVEASNLCIECHAGRDSGESVAALADSAMNNVSFKNSHYMAAAGLMYVKAGFTAFADPAAASGTIGTLNGVSGQSLTYGQSLTSDADGGALTSTHRKLGTAAMATDSHVGGQGLVTGGPCVTCHMSGKHHTLEMDASAFNGVCVNCHSKEGSTTLTADNFKSVFIEEQEEVFQDALALALSVLKAKYNISYNLAAYPYFYDDSLAPGSAVKDWTRGGTLSGAEAKKLMGACFNINILKRDPAAFAHARTYARRLLYDSIDFLDNKLMDKSVSATAVATTPAVYVNGGTSATSTAAFNYLVKFNGAGGTLDTTKERP